MNILIITTKGKLKVLVIADSLNGNDDKLSQKTYLINPFDVMCVYCMLDAK